MQNVMVTGAGRSYALGYNLVLRYLENGDKVIATVRQYSPELAVLKDTYGDRLNFLTMDIGSTVSVEQAQKELSSKIDHLDLIINNVVTVSPDCDKGFFEANLYYIADTVNVTSVSAMRVIKAFYPMLKRSGDTALIINISSEAGSISKCYRTKWTRFCRVDKGYLPGKANSRKCVITLSEKDIWKIRTMPQSGWGGEHPDCERVYF